MIMTFFDENEKIISYINGNLYERPFVGDTVIIDGKFYIVLKVAIDYDTNQLFVNIKLYL